MARAGVKSIPAKSKAAKARSMLWQNNIEKPISIFSVIDYIEEDEIRLGV